MRKTLLKKIYTYTVETWDESWDDFFNFLDTVPQEAQDLMDEAKRQAILEPFLQKGEDSKADLEKEDKLRYVSLMEELKLDPVSWKDWMEEVDKAEYIPDFDHPDLSIKPQFRRGLEAGILTWIVKF